MTREEAIRHIEAAKLMLLGNDNQPISDLYYALEIAIKALEQEPCEDTIRRQVVKEQMLKYGFHAPDMTVKEFVEDILPVNPQPKIGHWIGIDEEPHEDYECDRCGYVCSTFTANIKPSEEYKYCPNCGIKMIDPQKSEKINCKATKCENCQNHNYCDYEPQESEE